MQKIDASILIIDDNTDILTSLSLYLKHHFEHIETATNPSGLTELLNQKNFECIILDMNFRKGVNDGKEGLYWLNYIKETRPQTAVILLTAYGSVEIAVEALKRGASDFLVKPWKNERLLSTLIRSLELQRSKKEIHRLQSVNLQLNDQLSKGDPMLETKSPKMMEVLRNAERVAFTDANILILGENGTGKEILAQHIHKLSTRVNSNFIKVDVGAINPNLFESELYGHKKGAFTDAKSDRIGRFEMAHEGTLFLDEIGNSSLEQQAKLLSSLQNRVINPVGSNENIEVDLRLICATNSSLHQMTHENNFRQDLLFRINTVELKLPSLSERKEDIPMLGDHFLTIYKQKYHKPSVNFSTEALKKLNTYLWPGNIRELKHVVERAIILCDDKIYPEHLQLPNKEIVNSHLEIPSLKLEEVEKYCIQKAIVKHNGNISKTARELDINRNTLYRKMEKYGL